MTLLAGLSIAFAPPFIPIPQRVFYSFAPLLGTTPWVVWGLIELAIPIGTVIGLVIVVRCVEGKLLHSIALNRPKPADVFDGLMMFAGYLLILVVLSRFRHWFVASGQIFTASVGTSAPFRNLPRGLDLALAVANGVSEEMGARGFAITRLGSFTGGRFTGAALAYMCSIAVHLPFWGVGRLPYIIPAELIFVWYFLVRDNLTPCIIGHVLSDGFGAVVFPYLPVSVAIFLV